MEHYGTTQLLREVLGLSGRHGSKLLGISGLYGYPVGLGRPGLPFPIRSGATWPADPPWDSLFWLDDAGWSELSRIRKFKEYRSDIQVLAQRWGLCAAWGPVAVHSLTVDAGARLILEAKTAPNAALPGMEAWLNVIARSWPSVPVSLITASAARALGGLTWDVTTPWKPVEREITRQLRRVRDSMRASAIEKGLVTQEDTRLSLGNHVHWLFLRMCPRAPSGRARGWSETVRYKNWGIKNLTPSAVQKAVEPLAIELGITLPALKPGHPRNAPATS